MASIRLQELHFQPELRIDRQGGRLKNVRVLGLESLNGRRYLAEAAARAIPLCEGKACFVDHRTGNETRSLTQKWGWIEGVKQAKDGGLVAESLCYLKNHPATPQIVELASRAPHQLGLSWDAMGTEQQGSNGTVIEAITDVFSIDLVSDPATNPGLFREAYRRFLEQRKARTMTRRRRTREDMNDFGPDDFGGNGTPGASGDTDFDSAVAALRSCLESSSALHDDRWKKDVQRALDILEPWTADEAGDEGATSSQESRRRGLKVPTDGKEFLRTLEAMSRQSRRRLR